MNHGSTVAKDLVAERAYQARQALEKGDVAATPDFVMRRYRELQHWQLYRKECMFAYVRTCQPRRICDFGCGAGESSVELAALGYHVVGLDLSPDLIEQARRRAVLDKVTDRTEFMVANAVEASLPAGSFDLVFVEAVLHHMDVREGIEAVFRLVKPGGFAVIQEPVAFTPWIQRAKTLAPAQTELSPNERPLDDDDLRLLEQKFIALERRFFNGFYRLHHFIPKPFIRASHTLAWLDSLCLNRLGIKGLAGVVVYRCQKPL